MNNNDQLNNISKNDIVSNMKDREKFDKLANSSCLALKYLKRQSIERSTFLAVLYAGISNMDLMELLK